jgi:putative acetyltransferase
VPSVTTGGLVVREGVPQDAGALYELSLRAIHTSAAEHYSTAELAAWASRRSPEGHRRMLEQTYLLVAEADGAIAGFANLEAGTEAGAGVVDQLFVSPHSGGRGVARTLLDALEEHAVSQGMSHLDSHVSKRAIGVFERCGYRRVETERVTIDGEVLERYLVRKQLPPGI